VIEIFAADEQSAHPVDLDQWVALVRATLVEEGVRGPVEVSLIFSDETAITELNSRFMGKDGPTDVLSFPIDEEPQPTGRVPDSGGTGPGEPPEPEMPQMVGDVVICPSVAARNAIDRRVSLSDELALLCVHGTLHLLGWDHEDESSADLMEARERDLLARHYERSS
jgi:probable rRNA maturation factor